MFLLSSRRGGIEKAEEEKKRPELCPRPVAPATHSEAAKLYAQGYTQTHWYTHGFKSRKHTSSKATQSRKWCRRAAGENASEAPCFVYLSGVGVRRAPRCCTSSRRNTPTRGGHLTRPSMQRRALGFDNFEGKGMGSLIVLSRHQADRRAQVFAVHGVWYFRFYSLATHPVL